MSKDGGKSMMQSIRKLSGSIAAGGCTVYSWILKSPFLITTQSIYFWWQSISFLNSKIFSSMRNLIWARKRFWQCSKRVSVVSILHFVSYPFRILLCFVSKRYQIHEYIPAHTNTYKNKPRKHLPPQLLIIQNTFFSSISKKDGRDIFNARLNYLPFPPSASLTNWNRIFGTIIFHGK